jgi:uncharacterized membrane protein (DUF485 family)
LSTAHEDTDVYGRIRQSPEFAELRHRFRRFVFPLTAAFLAWYLLYVVSSGWARDFLGTKVLGHINIALLFGLLQFVSTFAIAYAYARYAERRLDPLAESIAKQEEGQ